MRQLSDCWPESLATVRLTPSSATVHEAWRTTVAVTIAPHLLPRPTPKLHEALVAELCGTTPGADWSGIPGWEAATDRAMRIQAEAIAERIASRGKDTPITRSAAPWLTAADLRPEQRPEDAERLLPAATRG